MLTPAGQECSHYYEDFNRGRNTQECRLVKDNPESYRWQPKACARCPVPGILRDNASKNMQLTLTLRPVILGFGRIYRIEAWCRKHEIRIDNPHTGCPQCLAEAVKENPALKLFMDALEDDDD